MPSPREVVQTGSRETQPLNPCQHFPLFLSLEFLAAIADSAFSKVFYPTIARTEQKTQTFWAQSSLGYPGFLVWASGKEPNISFSRVLRMIQHKPSPSLPSGSAPSSALETSGWPPPGCKLINVTFGIHRRASP